MVCSWRRVNILLLGKYLVTYGLQLEKAVAHVQIYKIVECKTSSAGLCCLIWTGINLLFKGRFISWFTESFYGN